MAGDLDIYGVYVPGFFLLMLAAYLLHRGMRYLAGLSGFYSLVWHRALFDLAAYVLILGGLFSLVLKFSS
jgi:hypothetical protein